MNPPRNWNKMVKEKGKHTILNMKFDTGTFGSAGHPKVEILPLPGFKVETIIAVVHVSNFVQHKELALGIELVFFPAMGKHLMEIFEEMSVPVLYWLF